MAPRAKSKKVDAAPQQARETPKPNWPAFSPLLPSSDLALEDLMPGQIVVIRNFWTSTLCKAYVSFLSSLPLVTTSAKPKKGEAVRVNDRFQIDDAQFAHRLWKDTGLESLLTQTGTIDSSDESTERGPKSNVWGGRIVGLNPNIRIYRYSKGQYFDQHYDDANNVTVPDPITGSATAAKTTWTLLLYLTSKPNGCHGGETVFYPDAPVRSKNTPPPEPFVIELETGMALLHKHGKDCMLHEGREVLEGEKWVIRSDLCVYR